MSVPKREPSRKELIIAACYDFIARVRSGETSPGTPFPYADELRERYGLISNNRGRHDVLTFFGVMSELGYIDLKNADFVVSEPHRWKDLPARMEQTQSASFERS